VQIRALRADEWRRWREARLRMLVEQPAYFGVRYEDAVREPDASWQEWTTEAAEGATRAAFVAEEDERWLGVVACHLRIDRSGTQLYSMWVDPGARGRGVAQALIREVAAWADERSCRDIYLFVQEANLPARALYERVGFGPTGTRQPMEHSRRGFKLLLSAPVRDLLG
jgi:ribosomal protein S18 acetylase RimI-like enzyme